MRKLFSFVSLALMLTLAACLGSCGSKYSYETVQGDPLKARIYTLENGLKVYMSVNKEAPRIQTYIVVRVGGKNDPSQNTGLAHYFEHLMFKGTENFGTQDYAQEKKLLDQIEQLFEIYRMTSDETERRNIYARIDSVSFEASKLSIPNEYDKLMSAIGAEGTNAYTAYDQTVYIENIPSNQIENWARIQSDRFKHNVIRGFHTELETVYEEKNMSLTDDGRKVIEAMAQGLLPTHPYGNQTVIGTQEHLKNPSITKIKEYYKTWYVPNNMAVCLSGDFDPDDMIAVIDKHFGGLEPNKKLPARPARKETPITSPVVKEVLGLEATNVSIGWRFDGADSPDSDLLSLMTSILYNGRAGLMDLDLNKKQQVLGAYAFDYQLADYSMLFLSARPKAGQSLEEIKDMLLGEVAKLRSGDFADELLTATLNNYKAGLMRQIDSNEGRVNMFENAFVNGLEWKDVVGVIDRLSKVTKQQVMDFANEKLGDDNYVVVYKREGKDPGEKKIDKPQITPLVTNRDVQSEFLLDVLNSDVKPIEPVFLDYGKDLSKGRAKSDIEVLYSKNPNNDLFTLIYLYEIGNNDNPALWQAFSYLKYLGTGTMTAEQISQEFYNIACSFSLQTGAERSYVTLTGLRENMDKAMELLESLLVDARADESVLANLKMDVMKSRSDAKLSQHSNFSALQDYSKYGSEYVKAVTLSNEALKNLSSDYLLGRVRELNSIYHRVLYYGPDSLKDVIGKINARHNVAQALVVPEDNEFMPLPTRENKVLLAEYDANNIYYIQQNNTERTYDASNDAMLTLYNEYFGGGMNSIVFQEMREARGLAYSATAWMSTGSTAVQPYTFRAFIATQSDKMGEAVDAFDQIINDMPRSEAAFNLAKDGIIGRMRTERIIKDQVLWNYIDAQDMGVDYDRRKDVFEKVQTITLDDVVSYQQEWVKDRPHIYSILGRQADMDIKKLESHGPVIRLTQEEIFGF